jgi:hypothetical protein
LPVACLFIAIGIARIVSTYHHFANTSDEPAHVACGLEYLADHVYHLEAQHPPLSRAMVALLPYLSGTRPRGRPTFQLEGRDIITYEGHPDLTMTRMRLGVLPFFVLACLVVFFWTRSHFSATSAVMATALFTLIPPVLAHAGLATTDMALTACVGLAFFLLVRWAEDPTWKRAALAGFACGLATLSKFTALGFLPISVELAFFALLAAERPSMTRLLALAKERVAGCAVIVAAACLTIWAGYWFSWDHGPAPEFFKGIQDAVKHNRYGHPAWLLDQAGLGGWWYYFPVALGVKTPLALLILWFYGLWLCWKNRRSAVWLLPVAFALGVLAPAMYGKINIGVRHVMPIYIAMSITAALGAEELLSGAARVSKRSWAQPIMALLLLAWMAVSGALHHPDYLPYFNELVQGDPDHVLVDSDYDWGQDTKRLAARLRELGVREINYGEMDSFDNHFLEMYPGFPHIVNIHPVHPAAGWTAVRPTLARTSQYGLEYRYPTLQPWFMYLTPREKVGTIWLYYVPPESVQPAK